MKNKVKLILALAILPSICSAWQVGPIKGDDPKIEKPKIKVETPKVPKVKVIHVEADLKKDLKKPGNIVNNTMKTTADGLGAVVTPVASLVSDINITEAQKEIDGAIKASSVFVEEQFKSVGSSISDAEQRLREGKILDAAYHLGTDQIKDSASNAAKAVSKSPLLNQVASAAASTYGGPAGAAGYAAWLTYETTGDLEAAMRAGALAGASAYANQYAKDPKFTSLSPELKRDIAKFSVNSAAIAASGGNEQDVLDALKMQAESSAKTQLMNSGQKWIKQEILPRIKDQTEIAEAPKTWEKLTVVEKAKKVKVSVESFKESVRKQVTEKTGIDPSTLTLG